MRARIERTWLVLVLALAGCQAHVPATRTDEPAGPVELAYSFSLHRTRPPSVRVEMEVAGSPAGRTMFRIAESWGGIERPETHVHGLTVRGPDGRELTVQRPAGHLWEVRHEPDLPLTVGWTLQSSGREQVHDPDYYYRPIVEPDRFHLIGNTGLLFPEHLATPDDRNIRVRWRGFLGAGWRVACSHGVAQYGLVTRRTVDAFRHAVFLAGPLRLHRREVQGRPLHVAVLGDWGFSDQAFVDLAARIVRTERAFFEDFDYPTYLISLIPVGRQVPGRTATGGTGLTDSFALFLTPGLSLAAGSRSRDFVTHLLAHELFHNWNGRKIECDDPERLVYWFTEGFTDYYARRLLFRAGTFDLDTYVSYLNVTSTRYHTNPYRNAPNQRIEADFWKDDEVRDLPYQRGALVAHLVDREIRKRSNGDQSLDDLMRALHRHSVETSERVDTKRLLGWIERYTSAGFAARVGRVVQQGETIELPPDLLAPCLKIQTRRIPLSFFPRKDPVPVPWFVPDQVDTCKDIL